MSTPPYTARAVATAGVIVDMANKQGTVRLVADVPPEIKQALEDAARDLKDKGLPAASVKSLLIDLVEEHLRTVVRKRERAKKVS